MYFLLGISITLAMLLIANVLVACVTSVLWQLIARCVKGIAPAIQAQIVFALRTFPVLVSVGLVLGYIVPAYVVHEPFESGEIVSQKMALMAAVSSIAVFVALYRVISSWLATRRLIAEWSRGAERLSIDAPVPVLRIVHEFPIIAVAGVFRPRMFIADKVLESLEHDELTAAIAHEHGHLAARDNLKRTLLRFCRDLILLPVGKTLERDWSEIAEAAADDHAADLGRKRALDLASALIKITRIVPPGAAQIPAGSFLIGYTRGDVTSRVQRLVNTKRKKPRSPAIRSVISIGLWSAAALILLLPLFDGRLYASTHVWIETFVHVLQ
jgi:Zn-dependent protease with chaperone function